MDLTQINQLIRSSQFEVSDVALYEESIHQNPFEQFVIWYQEILLNAKHYDPCAMSLSTVDQQGWPDTRIVLLKELEENKLIFFTSYGSKKGRQLDHQNVAALTFYWPDFGRQVRIRGQVEKVSPEKSAYYFSTRPRESQLSAYACVQSTPFQSKADINEKIRAASEQFSGKPIPCPEHWGGYAVTPVEYEFFQLRKWRMNDRLHYALVENEWKITRLAP